MKRFLTLHSQLTRAPRKMRRMQYFWPHSKNPSKQCAHYWISRPILLIKSLIMYWKWDKNSSLMSMGALQGALPKEEDLRFSQAVQCTTCLNSGHSAVDCTMRTQCMIFHSRAHTTDRCEYNLLNRQAAPVRHIEPRNGQDPEEERFRRDDRDRRERGDRYVDRLCDDYDRDEKRRDNYRRDQYK